LPDIFFEKIQQVGFELCKYVIFIFKMKLRTNQLCKKYKKMGQI
jgi:hypothetical protein